MGVNFVAVCHAHRVARFILKPHENPGLHAFWSEHEACARDRGRNTVQVVTDGSYTDPEAWVLAGYAEEIYPPEDAGAEVGPVGDGREYGNPPGRDIVPIAQLLPEHPDNAAIRRGR